MFSPEFIELFKSKTENLQKFIKKHIYDNIDKDKLDEFVVGELPEQLKEQAKQELKQYPYSELLNMEITDDFVKKNVMRCRLFLIIIFQPVIKENKLEAYMNKILEKLEYAGEDKDFVIDNLCKYVSFYNDICSNS